MITFDLERSRLEPTWLHSACAWSVFKSLKFEIEFVTTSSSTTQTTKKAWYDYSSDKIQHNQDDINKAEFPAIWTTNIIATAHLGTTAVRVIVARHVGIWVKVNAEYKTQRDKGEYKTPTPINHLEVVFFRTLFEPTIIWTFSTKQALVVACYSRANRSVPKNVDQFISSSPGREVGGEAARKSIPSGVFLDVLTLNLASNCGMYLKKPTYNLSSLNYNISF